MCISGLHEYQFTRGVIVCRDRARAYQLSFVSLDCISGGHCVSGLCQVDFMSMDFESVDFMLGGLLHDIIVSCILWVIITGVRTWRTHMRR